MEKEKYIYRAYDDKGNLLASYSEKQFAEMQGMLSKTQKVSDQLIALIDAMNIISERLQEISFSSDQIVSSLRGRLNAYSNVVDGIAKDLTSYLM